MYVADTACLLGHCHQAVIARAIVARFLAKGICWVEFVAEYVVNPGVSPLLTYDIFAFDMSD